ncbi:MAG TPA: PilZ domain-containing protein, partial [Candidatus Methylomirabilis sp.]|nr:PilZ domain-containing protein [Candidatus Methylomirabilis sp.]
FDDWMSLKMLVYLSSVRALTSTGGGSERRGSPRIELQVPMDYMRVPRCEKANTLNLSAQGVYLQTAASLDEGEEVFLWLPIPGEATSTPIRGRVVWRTPDASSDEAGMGIQFLDLPIAAQETIERYLAQIISLHIRRITEQT